MVYDFNTKRVGKALKISRKYLNWVQNSVLEGELTEARFESLKKEMKELMNKDEDSIIFYRVETEKYTFRESLGLKKGGSKIFL